MFGCSYPRERERLSPQKLLSIFAIQHPILKTKPWGIIPQKNFFCQDGKNVGTNTLSFQKFTRSTPSNIYKKQKAYQNR